MHDGGGGAFLRVAGVVRAVFLAATFGFDTCTFAVFAVTHEAASFRVNADIANGIAAGVTPPAHLAGIEERAFFACDEVVVWSKVRH